MNKKLSKKITIGIIIDTDIKIPPATGVTYRLYHLSKQLNKNKVNIKIFVCNRNIRKKTDEKYFKKGNFEKNVWENGKE